GFKWSRFNGCWQRQLTDNAYYGAARVFFGNDVLSSRQDLANDHCGRIYNPSYNKTPRIARSIFRQKAITS
ncbi:MAG: hypothetical protein IJB95_02745, partial [Clostridia bacterium]|nr:hypothetical protein [Clostridia bacterium]